MDDSDDEPDLAPWLDFQRWLELDAPYDVTVPFGAALYNAYEKRLQRLSGRPATENAPRHQRADQRHQDVCRSP